ncbi:M28 family metallopeptidase [Sphingomonas sp. BIUV-7]|uniref:M28 family metallopeptidase n=1 Tax=Sphingomonas natans TaxID=3063330 RepID=A0ABT8Y9N3_9SPHN|nr:M28 family metallopeptidase [Sphingomonas sp. BIUV-7]MDO6415056.1 M28 family metallopeptidase [Sphingomonas sp. BIUV-7]
MKSGLLCGVAFVIGAMPLMAQTAPSHFEAARIAGHIETLASDAYEGRGPATPGEEKSVAYISAKMAEAGLEPAGDPKAGGTRAWTQDVPLLRSENIGTPTISLTEGGTTKALAQGEEIAVRAPLDGTKAINIKNVPLVFVGYGITAPEKKWDDFKGVDVRGKLIVVLINDADFETGKGDFGGKAMTYYGRWTYKYEEAARRGAIGTLIVHESKPASYEWATVKNSNTNVMFDIVRDNPKASHAPVEAWIQRDLAVQLFRASGLDFDGAKKAAQTRAFKPMPLNATLSIDLTATSGRIVSHNVVGRVAGATKPDETLIYSAHWDHLGVGLADAKGDKIYNGAHDNASGVAALIEMGRAFAKAPKPQRSVLFLAVTAEEKGLLGSEYYATHPLYPLATTVGAINMDGIQMNGPAKNFSISGSAKLGLLDDLIAQGAKAGRTFTPEAHPEAGGFFRSDHFPMAKQGVPAISFKGGNDLVVGGTAKGEELAAAYTKDRYHQPADEWDSKTDLTGAVQDLDLLFGLGEQLANSREWPQWSADSEFKAARDKTATARK